MNGGTLEFRVLGTLEASRDGATVRLGGPKQRALLVILLLEANRVVSADRLIDALWGDDPPDTARNTLQVYISQLRKLFGPAVLETVVPGYRLTVDPEAVDLVRFERLFETGRAALADGDAVTAADALRSALSLWRGPPLADLVQEELAQVETRRLEELRLAAVEDRIDAELALGRHAALIPELEHLAADTPLRERLCAQLMLALYRSGRQADALAVYRRTRRLLVDELGIEPGATLQQLERAILAQDPDLEAPEATEAPKRRVPLAATPLLGRERELEALTELVRRDEVRLVTLTGIGGIGKTRLAVELVHRLASEFRDGAAMTALATIRDHTLVCGAIVQALGLDAGQDPEDALVRSLARSQLLLLLDNFEQVLLAAPAVARLLEAAPRLTIVVTSRAPLHVAAEHEFPVPPLNDDEAVELFVARARAAQPDFALGEQNASAVAELCARLDGLPLAIELAAARTKLLPPVAMLTRLGNRLDLLTGGRRDAPEHQQTLRTTLDWSYDLLAQEEQRLFASLAVFAGGCTLEAAELVCQAGVSVFDGLATLVDESLLSRHGDQEPRLSMLETVREYAAARLAASGQDRSIRRRHLEYFLAFAEEADSELVAGDQITWFGRLELEHDNLRAALAFALDENNGHDALRLAVALRRLWQIHGHLAEGRRAFEAALTASSDVPSLLRANALNGTGILAGEQGEFAVAQTSFEAALDTARTVGDTRLISSALVNLGNLASFRGDLDTARRLYTESIEHFASLGDLRGQALAKENLGLLALTAGDTSASLPWLTEARELARDAGDDREAATAARSLAAAMLELGETNEARALLGESLRLSRELGEPHAVAVCLDVFAGLAVVTGDAERAATLFGASDAVRSSIGALRQPDHQILYDRWLSRTLTDLETATYTARYEEGHALSLDESCEFALATAIAV